MRTLYVKTGTGNDSAPSGVTSGQFAIAAQTRGVQTGTLRCYIRALSVVPADVAGVTGTAQLWLYDTATTKWYAEGPAQAWSTLQRVSFLIPTTANGLIGFIQITGVTNPGATATIEVHGEEAGAYSDIDVSVSGSGLATAALQTAGNTTLTTLNGKFAAGLTGAQALASVASVTDVLPLAQYLAAGVTLTDTQFTTLLTTLSGFLKVSLGDEIAGENRTDGVLFQSPRAISSTTGAWTNYASAAKVGTVGISVKTTSGRLRSIRAVNVNTTTLLYLLVVDKATAPVANDLPIDCVPIPANTAASVYSYADLDWNESGKTVANGFAFAISTTPDKVTLPATSDVMVFARYA